MLVRLLSQLFRRVVAPVVAVMFLLSLFSFPVIAAAASVNFQQFIPNPNPGPAIGFYSCTSSSPCPMGPTDYGVNGKTDYSYNTTAFRSWANFTKLNIGDCNEQGCNGQMTIQQNTVLYGVYEQASSKDKADSGEYWIQDVPYITQTSKGNYEINLLDNIWNFSAGNAEMSGTIYGNLKGDCSQSGGQPEFYYCLGNQEPTVTLPFQVEMTVNASVLDSGSHKGSTAVEFWIAVYQNKKLVMNVPFDEVAWNAKAPASPYFLVGGQNPLGLFNDAEDVLCGPGGGSSVILTNVAAKMTTYYFNTSTSKWTDIPHAWSAGTDTAETVSGAALSKGTGNTAVAKHGTDNNVQLW